MIEVTWRPLTTAPLSDDDAPVRIAFGPGGDGIGLTARQAVHVRRELSRLLRDHLPRRCPEHEGGGGQCSRDEGHDGAHQVDRDPDAIWISR